MIYLKQLKRWKRIWQQVSEIAASLIWCILHESQPVANVFLSLCATVRADFSSRMDAAREESRLQLEEYEERIDKLQEELDAKKKESREAMYQHDEALDKIKELEKELELKGVSSFFSTLLS